MDRRIRWVPLLLPIAALAAGCDGSPTSPEPVAEEFDVLSDLREDPRAAAPAQPAGPTLHVLFRSALRAIARDEDPETARRILDGVVAIRQEARAAWDAGDLDGARAKLLEARLAMAEAVLTAYGDEAVDRVLRWVEVRVNGLRGRQAELDGAPAQRLARLIRHLDELVRASHAAAGRGEEAAALDYATRAAEVLLRFLAARAQI